MILLIEFGLFLLVAALAFLRPQTGSRFFEVFEQRFAKISEKRGWCVLAVGAVAVLARIAVLPILPVPQPWIADEFSHLLLADTLVHGRLNNPTHPMWIHFETIHEIMRPSYASMYPPAQGFFLAIGKLIAGSPFAGVCLSVGVMCAAICWMLQAWVAPPWALLGGLIAVMRLAVFSYWGNSYWGGAAAATGGALLLGALGRIWQRKRVRDAILMAAGLALLANSRPYEGLIFSLPVAAALGIWFFRMKAAERTAAWKRVIAPLAACVLLLGIGMGYYFWRVTGSPFRMPYQVDRSTYAMAPYFLWQAPALAPIYHQKALQDFYTGTELDFYTRNRTLRTVLAIEVAKAGEIWLFYLGPALTIPLIFVFAAVPYGTSWHRLSRRLRFLLIALTISLAGLAIEVFFFPHYAAPMTALLYGFVLMAMEGLQGWQWQGKQVGRFLTRAVPVVCMLVFALRAGATPLRLSLRPNWPPTWYNLKATYSNRARFQAQLEGLPGRHIVLVRYAPSSSDDPGFAWVYNAADIDQAKIVWAWDMGEPKNRELLDYFKGRHIWIVRLDNRPLKLEAYSPAS